MVGRVCPMSYLLYYVHVPNVLLYPPYEVRTGDTMV